MLSKPQPVISQKIREFAKGRPCTLRIPGICEDKENTTCACHLNSNAKGWANKSPDFLTVIGCANCHAWLDGGYVKDYSREYRDAEALRAFKETLIIYHSYGLISVA